MSYTNGGQTIDKSMNGIITFDTGGGVVIEGGDVTATGITADNIVCDTLQVNTSATFAGTSTFDDNLPTSVITSTTSNDQFITKAIGDTLYAGGGILADNNVWTGTNAYNTYLPTSNITTTTNTNQIAPIAVLNTLYGRLGIANTWSARNTFSSGITVATDVSCNSINCASSANFGSSVQVAGGVVCDGCLINPQNTMQIRGFDSTGQYVFTNNGATTPKYIFGFDFFSNSDKLIIEPTLSTFFNVLKIKSPATTTTATSALVIENTEVSPSQINFLLNAVASTANPNVTAGDDVIYSNGGVLNLTTSSATAVGIRMSQTDIQTRANTTTLTGTTLTNNITTTNINSTTLAISSSTATTFVNLPSTTTTFTTATANQFITKSIGDALYPAIPTGGYARLTTVANTFTNANTFNAGVNNTVFYGSAVILSTTNNVAETPSAGATATPAFRIRNYNDDTKAIKFVPLATVDALNPITEANDSVISGSSVLTLTAEGATEVGMRIADGGGIDIKGTTITAATTSYTLFSGNAGIMRTTNNVIETTAAGTSALPTLRIRVLNDDTRTIKFIAKATASALNPITVLNDGVISADSVLTLTADGATASGIRILDTGVVNILGTTTNLNATTTTFGGTTTNVGGTNVILRATNNVAESTSNIALATPAFRIRGFNSDAKTIKFIPQATAGALNPLVQVNDGVISADANLTITADSTITTGIRITEVGDVYIDGVTTFLDATNLTVNAVATFFNPIKFSYTAIPPFVDGELGYNIEPISNTITAPNANQIYVGNTFTLTRGVWIVKAFCGIYASINQARVYMSINTNNLAHDVGNRTFCFCPAGGLGDLSFQVNKVFVVTPATQTYYALVSSNLANPNVPTYYVSYQATRIA